MDNIVNLLIFYGLAAIIVVSAVLAVTSRKMLRAATYLLFVLIGTAGLYLMLNYHFLAVTQLSIYAGGILILFIFAILLTSTKGERSEMHRGGRLVAGGATALAGMGITIFVIMKNNFLYGDNPTILGDQEMSVKEIGHALMGTDKYGYLMSFEALSVLLLACIIGGILIARKR